MSLNITVPLIRHTNVCEDEAKYVLIEHTSAIELHGRNSQSFLEDLGCVRTKAARHVSANVRPVPSIGQEGKKLPTMEHWFDHANIHEMGATGVWIIDKEDVPILNSTSLGVPDYRLRRELHDADKDRETPFALRNYLPSPRMIYAVREIVSFRDRWREGSAL